MYLSNSNILFFRTKFLLETLEDLQQQLIQLNISLLVFKNTPDNKIMDICKTYQIECIYKQKEWTNDEVNSLKTVKKTISQSLWKKQYKRII